MVQNLRRNDKGKIGEIRKAKVTEGKETLQENQVKTSG